jgi:hypothetical protein
MGGGGNRGLLHKINLSVQFHASLALAPKEGALST